MTGTTEDICSSSNISVLSHLKRPFCGLPVYSDGKCALHCKGAPAREFLYVFQQAINNDQKRFWDVSFQNVEFGELRSIIANARADQVEFDWCNFPSFHLYDFSKEQKKYSYRCLFRDSSFGAAIVYGPLSISLLFLRCAFTSSLNVGVDIPALHFDNCSFEGDVLLQDTRLKSLAFNKSRFTSRLSILNSQVDELDLSDVNISKTAPFLLRGLSGADSDGVLMLAPHSPLDKMSFVDVTWRKKNGRILLRDESVTSISPAVAAASYRKLINNFESVRDYDNAEDCFISAMEVEKRGCRPWRRMGIRLYGALSRYGSSYGRAASVLLAFIIGSACLYAFPITTLKRTELPFIYAGYDTFWRGLGRAFLHSIEVAIFSKKHLYETTTPFGRIVEAIETIVVPAQAALLLFAIRRRFKR